MKVRVGEELLYGLRLLVCLPTVSWHCHDCQLLSLSSPMSASLGV